MEYVKFCIQLLSVDKGRPVRCEQIGKSHRTGLPLSTLQPSNIRLHCDRCRVSATETDFSILSGCERNSETLLILESMYILKFKPRINNMNSAHKFLVCN